jgi:hypothetical protein
VQHKDSNLHVGGLGNIRFARPRKQSQETQKKDARDQYKMAMIAVSSAVQPRLKSATKP